MFHVRFHGRGGQGAVTAAEVLASAACLEGKYAQALPSFGPERTGAPVTAYCRIDDHPIRSHEPVTHPDAVVVQDPTLPAVVDVFQGLVPGGPVLLNAAHASDDVRVVALDATAIAAAVGKPNAALLGGLVALTHVVRLDSLLRALEMRFGVGPNARAAAVAFARLEAR